MSALAYLALAVVSTAVVWKGSAWLESSSERLAAHYGLPDVVRGAVVVAVGSSFPELSAAVLSPLVHGDFELGMAAVVGSALFNVLVIPALATLLGGGPLASNRDLVYKEAQFYMLAVAVLLLTFSFAVIYAPVDVPGGSPLVGEIDRTLALVPLAMYGVYVFVQYQDTMEYRQEAVRERIRVRREWLLLLAGLAVILAGVEGLVRSAVALGRIFETPSFFWGITIVAAGTSVPDAFVSVRAARRGHAVTSLANVLGSNVFDLLVAIPAGVLVAGGAIVHFGVAAPLMGVLTLATLALFTTMRTGMTLDRGEAWTLLALYGGFVLWIALESFGAVDLVPTLPP